ncbi:MAG: ParB domain protein nuclease [Parcubacteria group bacterium GW2011_GWA2_51_10]|nr:MAG: ParB domain protein nuclease [Parcubacteria group bacterium GW2011_GWA2_51_10]
MATNNNLQIVQVPVSELKASEYNPRKWSEAQTNALRESITRFGLVDPILCNGSPERKNIVIGGHFRLKVATDLGYKEMPVVYVNITDLEKEKELNIRLNKNLGEFDLDLLKDFGEEFLVDVGFSTEELDSIFEIDPIPEKFDLQKELSKLKIDEIKVQKGDVYEIDGSRLMCGDSTIQSDMLKLMDGARADMCFTDPPYILDYLRGKTKNGKPTEGFGLKKDRKYLETDVLPDNFTELWMANVAKVQKVDFSVIVFEHPKNLRTIWNELEKNWRYRNTITWHVPNRVQGFSAKYKFFNKQDIALVGMDGDIALNLKPEDNVLFQNEYENALYATSGKPHWEGYEKGKKIQPTDFIEHIAADEKSSGQGIIFGTKPLELLIPYIKVLTKRGDLILEPFGGSGSTLIASLKLGRNCRIMEKSPVYTEVIKNRWEKHTGKTAKKIN